MSLICILLTLTTITFFMILQQVIPNITAESVLLAVVGVYSIAVQSLVSLLDIGAYYFLVYAAMVLLQ